MLRKQMQVLSPIKNIVQDLKKHLELKSEGDVIAYLYAFYSHRSRTLTLEEHKQILQEIEEINNQGQI
ncbi:hypothetical protein D3C76_389510 [compost metagenome]